MLSNTINQKDRRTHHTPGHNLFMGGNSQMLSEKGPVEKLNENDQKRLQKIVGNSYIML